MVSMLLILSLIVCTCMILVYKDSFSWLSYNKNANVGNMGMSVDFDDADAVYKIYKWDIDNAGPYMRDSRMTTPP